MVNAPVHVALFLFCNRALVPRSGAFIVSRLGQAIPNQVQAAAQANGLLIEDNFLTKMIADTEKMAPYYTSMHLDKRAGRETEFEAIIGEPLRRGRLKGLKLPAMSDLYRKLSKSQVERLESSSCWNEVFFFQKAFTELEDGRQAINFDE